MTRARRWSVNARTFVPAIGLAAVVGALAASDGGYFAPSWGWALLAFIFTGELWLIASGRSDADRLDLAFLAAMTAFLVWTTASLLWSINPAQTIQEVERGLTVLCGVTAFVALVRRTTYVAAAASLVIASTLLAGYGLATRLFPGKLTTFESTPVYRLSEPVGYWNGLGILCVMGIILAVGLVLTDRSGYRAIGGAALIVLPVAVFFTYSRGSWVALAVGACAVATVSPRRLQLAGASLALAPVTVLALLAASRSHGLTYTGSSLADATRDGRLLAFELIALTILAMAIAVGLGSVGSGVALPEPSRRIVGIVLLCVVVVGTATVFARAGSPLAIGVRAYQSFVAPPPPLLVQRDLNSRLSNFSGNGRADLWRIAWDAYERRPVVGSGAGTYERVWQADPRASFKVRDAHSLYLEVLQELGPPGLVILAMALVVPLIGSLRARHRPVIPACAGAFVAFLVHAGTDWDWELAGITLFALAVATLMLAAARTREPSMLPHGIRLGGIVAAIALGGVAVGSMLGNTALAGAQEAMNNARYADAEREAARAQRLQPWSSIPWIIAGEAQYRLGRLSDARASFRRATQIDGDEWRAWLDRAVTTSGAERERSLARARALYPSSSMRQEVETILAIGRE